MSNYEVGRRFEYERMKYYKEQGYNVMRTAGSHGLFDLICLKRNQSALCVQCKVVQTERDAARLIDKFMEAGPIGGDFHERIDIKVRETRSIVSKTV